MNDELIIKNKNLLKECENQKNEIDKLKKLLSNEGKKVDDLNEKINFEINKGLKIFYLYLKRFYFIINNIKIFSQRSCN